MARLMDWVRLPVFQKLIFERIKILPKVVNLVDDLVQWEERHFRSWGLLLPLGVGE